MGLSITTKALAAAAGAILATGGWVATLDDTPAAATPRLPHFSGCTELDHWAQKAARRVMFPMYAATPQAAAGSERAPVGSSATGTNVQEAGVDEPDTAKTDGNLLLRVVGGRLVIDDQEMDGGSGIDSHGTERSGAVRLRRRRAGHRRPPTTG